MEEKYMVNDILESVTANLTAYEGAITETEHMDLRQTLQQIRNNDESFQYELFKVAQVKQYYTPAEEAKKEEIIKVKNEVNN